jgi:hypothetical protein
MEHWLGALTVARFVPARQLFIPIATGPAVADQPDAPRFTFRHGSAARHCR